MNLYNDRKALRTIYPENQHIWQHQSLKRKGYWRDAKNRRLFFDQLANKLNLKRPEDWYRVTSHTVVKEGGHFIKTYYNGSVVQGTQIFKFLRYRQKEITLNSTL
jgi:hypothetical protein